MYESFTLAQKTQQTIRANKEIILLLDCINSGDFLAIQSKDYKADDFGPLALLLNSIRILAIESKQETDKFEKAIREADIEHFLSINKICDPLEVQKMESKLAAFGNAIDEVEKESEESRVAFEKRLATIKIMDLYVVRKNVLDCIKGERMGGQESREFFTACRTLILEIKSVVEALIAANGRYGNENGELVFYDDEYIHIYNEKIERVNKALNGIVALLKKGGCLLLQPAKNMTDSKQKQPSTVEASSIQKNHLGLSDV